MGIVYVQSLEKEGRRKITTSLDQLEVGNKRSVVLDTVKCYCTSLVSEPFQFLSLTHSVIADPTGNKGERCSFRSSGTLQ